MISAHIPLCTSRTWFNDYAMRWLDRTFVPVDQATDGDPLAAYITINHNPSTTIQQASAVIVAGPNGTARIRTITSYPDPEMMKLSACMMALLTGNRLTQILESARTIADERLVDESATTVLVFPRIALLMPCDNSLNRVNPKILKNSPKDALGHLTAAIVPQRQTAHEVLSLQTQIQGSAAIFNQVASPLKTNGGEVIELLDPVLRHAEK